MRTSSLKRNLFPSFLIVALLSCCATLILSSCSKKASVAIIGKWQAQGTKETVEFRKDGTLINPQNQKQNGIYTFTDGSHIQNGIYTFTHGSHINLQINTGDTNQPEISASCEVHIHGDKMDMTMTVPGQGQQQKTHLTRLK
jgi:hypothetical protein